MNLGQLRVPYFCSFTLYKNGVKNNLARLIASQGIIYNHFNIL